MDRQRLTLAMADSASRRSPSFPDLAHAGHATTPQSVTAQAPSRRSTSSAGFVGVGGVVERDQSPATLGLSLHRPRRPRHNRIRPLQEMAPRTDQVFPVSRYALILAIPLAMVVLSFLMNAVVDVRDIFARNFDIAIPTTDDVAAIAVPRVDRGGEPLSIDASDFEAIRRTEYEVQPGDTISDIAYRFGLNSGTVIHMNPVDDVRRLLPGTILSIPDRDGLFYAVQPGDSVYSIAEAYGVSMTSILDANDIESPVLLVGDALFIPGAEMDETDYLLAIGELLEWPVRNYRFTSGYGMRVHPISGTWLMHSGIDLANSVGTPVLAARSGRIAYIAEQDTNYGKMIIIDHGNGIKTLYAHLDSVLVSQSEWVSTQEQIATMGNTGRSTGSHLHFSVFRNDQMEDPLRHLP